MQRPRLVRKMVMQCERLGAAGHSSHQVQPQNLTYFLHVKPRLGHHFAPRWQKARRVALSKACVDSPRPVTAQNGPMPDSIPAHDGHRSDMADSIPLIRQIVPHQIGTVSVMLPEGCPSSPRNPVRHGPAHAHSAQPWRLIAPLGPIEAEELRWYLEKYAIWPSQYFQDRARREGLIQMRTSSGTGV